MRHVELRTCLINVMHLTESLFARLLYKDHKQRQRSNPQEVDQHHKKGQNDNVRHVQDVHTQPTHAVHARQSRSSMLSIQYNGQIRAGMP
jgi:hypothetical protein